jgi:hypothetical protein
VRGLLRRVIIWALSDPKSIAREQAAYEQRIRDYLAAVREGVKATEYRWGERNDPN